MNKFPPKYLNNEMGEKFLGVLTSEQKIDLIGSYNCYQINLAEASTYSLFVKSRKVIAGLVNPIIKTIRNQMATASGTGTRVLDRKLLVLKKANQLIKNTFIKKVFVTLNNALNKRERAAHANCGGRIIMFTRYFKAS